MSKLADIGINMNIENLVYEHGLRKGLSKKTIKTYTCCINKFFRICRKKPNYVLKTDIESYILRLIKSGKASSTVHVHTMAIRFFFEQILRRRLTLRIPNIKIKNKLPEFLSQEEMSRLISVINNSKHKLIVMFTYGSGFRVSEVINLRVRDLDLEAGYGWIRHGKGGKDRMFIIPKKLIGNLQKMVSNLQSDDFVFRSYGKKRISDSSVRMLIKRACKLAGIEKKISPHSLRHSFATHLLENGYSLLEVRDLLGHSNIETTMVYTHLARPKLMDVRSPFDTLQNAIKQ